MISSILDIGSKIIDKIFPDKNAAEQAKIKLLELQQAGELKEIELQTSLLLEQAKTNQIEAQSSDLFKSGWRPAIGWVCALGFAYEFFFRPLLSALLASHSVTFPILDTSELMTLTFGMLGLAGIRSFDKLKKGK